MRLAATTTLLSIFSPIPQQTRPRLTVSKIYRRYPTGSASSSVIVRSRAASGLHVALRGRGPLQSRRMRWMDGGCRDSGLAAGVTTFRLRCRDLSETPYRC